MTSVIASTNTKPERCVEVKYSNVRVVGNGMFLFHYSFNGLLFNFSGSFGVVYVARLSDSGEPVAIKKVVSLAFLLFSQMVKKINTPKLLTTK